MLPIDAVGQETERLMQTAMVNWDTAVSLLSQEMRQDVARQLEAMIERGARLLGYLEERGVTGCGDGGHIEGVKGSNRLAAKVRKALGFTYPKQDVRF
jgi:hypothetical protein